MKIQNVKLICALFAVAAMGTTGASANSVVLAAGSPWASWGIAGGSYDPYQDGDGGEFGALNVVGNTAQSTTPAGYSSLAEYTFGAGDNPSGSFAGLTAFETFCVEAGNNDVYFNPGQVYNSSLSENIIGGRPMTLSVGTAWLYSQFAQGVLAGYDYTTDGGRGNSAGDLQNAIWFLQGEIGNPGNAFSNAALTLFGNTVATESVNAYTTNFGVEVMNLTDSNGASAQNQLFYSEAVPDGGLTVGLLGIALLALAFAKRRTRVA